MDHTLEKHLNAINSMCRLCARLCVTKKQKKQRKTPCPLDKIRKDLTLIGLVLRTDKEDVHSRFVCEKCKLSLDNSKRTESVTYCDKLRKFFQDTADIWCAFDVTKDTNTCTVCCHRAMLSTGFSSKTKTDLPIDHPHIDLSVDAANAVASTKNHPHIDVRDKISEEL